MPPPDLLVGRVRLLLTGQRSGFVDTHVPRPYRVRPSGIVRAVTDDAQNSVTGRWIFSAWKHLRRYDATAIGRMGATAHAGRAGDLLGRLRMLQTYPVPALAKLAADAGMSGPEMAQIALPALEAAGGLRVERDANGQPTSVLPLAINEADVMEIIAALWRAFTPGPPEQAAMIALQLSSEIPRTKVEVLERCTELGLSEEAAKQGLELAGSVGLVKNRYVADIEADLYYNEYLWGDSISRTADALGRLPRDVKENLVSLLSELHESEGRPSDAIESASPELVRFAAEQGIIEQTEIVTSDGRTAKFSFTPRLKGFGVTKDDLPDELDQVRLVIASLSFAHHHATNRLADPVSFLDALVDRGVAGSAKPIATDYGALEKQQIVRVEPIFEGAYNHRFVALKKDSLITARDTMAAGEIAGGGQGGNGALLDSRSFRDPVGSRIELGQSSGPAPLHQEDLLAAVRDAAQGTRPRSESGS